jgi:hypothetical protein
MKNAAAKRKRTRFASGQTAVASESLTVIATV